MNIIWHMSEYNGLHKLARNCFIIWRSSGKPMQGEEFESMRQTILQFKYALPYVKQHDNNAERLRWRRNLLSVTLLNSGRKSLR